MITKKYQNYYKTWLLISLCFGFLVLAQYSYAEMKLEVQYPTIAGQTITNSTTLPGYVKYLFNLGTALGFLAIFISLVWAGVMFLLSPVNIEMKASAKDRVSGAISGFLILTLLYLIVTTINPLLSIFSLTPLPPPSDPPEPTTPPGAYFYETNCIESGKKIGEDCDSTNNCAIGLRCDASSKKCANMEAHTSNVIDLGALKNKLQSVGIVQDAEDDNYYISILYNNVDLWGKCLYLNPNETCHSESVNFAASASIHKFDDKANGDGVYFYRKTCFAKDKNGFEDAGDYVNYCNKNSGGYFKVTNDCIANGSGCGVEDDGGDNFFVASLDDLKFVGDNDPASGECTVPEQEQDCIKYDESGNCAEDGRQCPTLAGENISSLIINRDYVVVFIYFGPSDQEAGPWTYCQEFPTSNDVNNFGPQQMKWENIRNSGGVVPNYVMIIPIQNEGKKTED